MGFFDRFFGPPTLEVFAGLVMKVLRELGDTRQPTFERDACRIVFKTDGGEAGVMNLHNLYAEYCNAPKHARSALLRRFCLGLLKQMDLPEDFEDAKPDLLPTIRPKSMLDVMRLDVEIQGGTWREMAVLPLSEHLVICLVYDMPTTLHFVHEDQLATWGISIYEALEVAKHNLEEREFTVGSIGEKLFVFVTGDSFDATRMLLLDRIRSLNLIDQPVALPINRESLMIAGSEDEEGLGMLADLAEKKRDEPRPICPILHRLNGDEWEPWLPPPDSPHYEKFRILRLRYLGGEYAEQKELLEKRNIQTGQDIFLASFSAVERDGKLLSYSVWSKGVQTWLPKTDNVGLYIPETEQMGFVPWERLQNAIGDLMKPLDCYPPRWVVNEFPSQEQFDELVAG